LTLYDESGQARRPVAEARSPAPRILRVSGTILIFLMLAGATYQGVATALERREFPRPGGLVSVGDHQLHLFCLGTGSPSVILEAPAAGPSAVWGVVQRALAGTTRVCSYDRAGLGWSEAGDQPYDPGRVPEELRTLLTSANERGPFVLGGHGLGAAFARSYAARTDADVAALVLIDPPAEGGPDPQTAWIMPASPWLARVGVLRAGRIIASRADVIGGAAGAATRAFLNRPDHLTRAAAEVARWDAALQIAAAASVPAHVPITVVESGDDHRIAFLDDGTDVARVVAALAAAVDSARQRDHSP
jgi:pimeloyl-ACP methyl ester carboxylesterase